MNYYVFLFYFDHWPKNNNIGVQLPFSEFSRSTKVDEYEFIVSQIYYFINEKINLSMLEINKFLGIWT